MWYNGQLVDETNNEINEALDELHPKIKATYESFILARRGGDAIDKFVDVIKKGGVDPNAQFCIVENDSFKDNNCQTLAAVASRHGNTQIADYLNAKSKNDQGQN